MEHTNAYLLKNKPLPKGAEELVSEMTANGEKILFVIVGDLSRNGKYAESALIVSRERVTVFDGGGGSESFRFSELSEVRSKRMYGNATLSARIPERGRVVLFRYTYAVAALCDAAALFINHINAGDNFDDEMSVMEVVFERALSVCPKCGRALLHPGAECIMCRSKVKVVERLISYISPEKGKIAFCIILSLIATAMAIVPPTVTGFIVDAVFPGGSGASEIAPLNMLADMLGNDPARLLPAMIILLLVTYILQYGIGIIRSYTFREVA